jgi:thioesterase domain-containing protein
VNPAELTDYLRARIPLVRAMAVEVRMAGPAGVTLYAPLAPNINHRDTVFGGSASAVAILAAWSALYVRMQTEGLEGRIVIRRNTMDYERPIVGGFIATATAPDDAAVARLRAALARTRAARVDLGAVLECDGARVGALQGEFAVLTAARGAILSRRGEQV